MKLTRQDFRIGAIYRFGLKRRLDADQLECLLINRAGFKPSYAKQLVAHWMTSEPYRVRQ